MATEKQGGTEIVPQIENFIEEGQNVGPIQSNQAPCIPTISIQPSEDVNVEDPKVGMRFNNFDEAYECYNQFARKCGFGIAILHTSSKGPGKVRYTHIGCYKAGESRHKESSSHHRDSVKSRCLAGIKVKSDKSSGQWIVYDVHLEHNHELNPYATRYLRSHRKICTLEKTKIRTMHVDGIPTAQILSTIARRKDDIKKLNYTKKDCQKYIHRQRQLQLKDEDAQTMIDYFHQAQMKNPSFVSLLDLNENQQLRNVFWIHPQSRIACKHFGDVICFDTSYLANSYQIPMALFIGVNHHGQSQLLGCALLSNEKIESFIWIFKCWLETNGGRAPSAIITDQDKAIELAVAEIFPNAKHRFCLWRIMKKIPEKIGSFTRENPPFMHVFDNCIYDSLTTQEFEEKWGQLILQYEELKDSEWINGLYDLRHKWVPVYLKDHFFAGMSTSQRGESINHFFDGYINSKTTLKKFIEKYEQALQCRFEAENVADFKTIDSSAVLKTSSPMEKQAADMYTRSIFKYVQDEVVNMAACVPVFTDKNGSTTVYRIKAYEKIRFKEGHEKQVEKEYTVTCDTEQVDVHCICKCFQFRGYLCRHALLALQFNGISKIPEKYVLKRWTKDMRYRHVDEDIVVPSHVPESEEARYNVLSYRLMSVVGLGSITEKAYNLLLAELPNLKRKLIDANAESVEQRSVKRSSSAQPNSSSSFVCKTISPCTKSITGQFSENGN